MFGLAARRLAATTATRGLSYGLSRASTPFGGPAAPATRLGRRQIHQGRALRHREEVSKAPEAPKLPTSEKAATLSSPSGPEWDEFPLWLRGLVNAVAYGGTLVVCLGAVLVASEGISHGSMYYMYWTLKRQHPLDPDLQSYDAWLDSWFYRYYDWNLKLHDAGFRRDAETLKWIEQYQRLKQRQPDFDLDAEIRKRAEELTGVRVDAEADWIEVFRRLEQQQQQQQEDSDK